MPKLKRNWVASQKSAGKDMVPYPHVIMNCTVQLERLNPAMLEKLLPQTQKKEVSTRIWKYSKKELEQHRTFGLNYRKRQMKGFNLLKKCVPGTKKVKGNKKKRFSRPDLLMSAVKYIKELENKIKELEKESPMESTPLTDCETGMERDSVGNKKQDCTHSAPIEPLMPEITSSPTDLDTGLSSPTDLVTGLSSYSDLSEPNSRNQRWQKNLLFL
jgi:hypothetical protein